MSISPESFASDSQRYGWKIEKQGLDAAGVFTKLYNLARPEGTPEITAEDAQRAIDAAHDTGVKTIGKFRGVQMAFAPDGNTTSDPKNWDLFSYLKANDSVEHSALKASFGDALQPMPLYSRADREASTSAAATR